MWKKRKEAGLEKEEKKERGRNNREFYFTGAFFSLLFLAMIAYYVYFVQEKGREMINNSYNSRQYILASQNTRGTIYSADEEVLAVSQRLIAENREAYEVLAK